VSSCFLSLCSRILSQHHFFSAKLKIFRRKDPCRKFFVRTSTILYGQRKCLRQTFSFLFSSSFKSGLIRFYTKLHKKKKKSFVVKHSVKEREREREREERTLFHFAIISSRLIRRVVVSSRRRSDHHSKTFVSILTRKESIINKREKI
jgi:hypothetical protein